MPDYAQQPLITGVGKQAEMKVCVRFNERDYVLGLCRVDYGLGQHTELWQVSIGY
nr:hypothetical protein [Pseudarthrobacter sp. NBSH8]